MKETEEDVRRKRLALLAVLGMLVALLPVGAAPAGATGGDHLLLSEIVVTPTAGEFIEIHNPTGGSIDLADYYVTDATFAPGGAFYYNIVTGLNAGGGSFGDFHARFPVDATIAAGAYQTIALAGSTDFNAEYGILPTYELYEDDVAPDAVPDMREALPGSINGQGGLTNAGEVVVLYHWNGESDLVQDVDYALWGDKDEAVDKTGVSIDGPDADSDPSTYLPDTPIAAQDVVAGGAHPFGESFLRSDLSEGAETPTGGNGVTGDDEMSEDLSLTWGEPPPEPTRLTIMEIQGDGLFSPYAGEFIETSGVVTAISANGRDAWIQDPVGDDDPTTSDGIFVDDFNGLTPNPVVGDLIVVTGEPEDQQFGNALPLTRINNTELVEIVSSDNVTIPVEVVDLPDESVDDAIEFWSSLEGMLISVRDGRVVAPTSRFGEFAMLTRTDAKPGSGYEPSVKQILLRSIGENVVDYNPERIVVDDATLDDAIQVRPGDTLKGFVGVVDYSFGMYKMQPVSVDKMDVKQLPDVAVSTRSGPNGDTAITTYNVENLFDLELNMPTAIDVFGEVGFDPGSSWGPPSTANNTLLRNGDVCAGRTDTGPFDPSLEWVGTGNNNFDDLGVHTTTCSPASGLFISEYIEGSSFNKAVEIYNGTGAAVNLAALNVTVQVFNNGSSNPSQTIGLSGTIADGDVFVLAQANAAQPIKDVADQLTSSGLWNGDDAIMLSIGGKDDAGSTPTPEELETQLTKLALSIEHELRLPEIMILQEVENTAIAQELGDRVNAANGTDYVAVSYETSDGRGIEVAFLYDNDRADLLDSFQLSGPAVEAAFGPASASPGREPLYGMFQIGDDVVHIVGNHFKSKGGDDPIFGVSFNRVTEVQRKAQAGAVRDFVDELLAENAGAMVMITGDLNDFQFGEPDEGPNHPVAILEGIGGGEPFTNLIYEEKEAERWTFLFDGNSQVLDHMLVNNALLRHVTAVDILHFNAAFPSVVGADEATTIRASDHDPIEGRFVFGR